jgi:hypothetical protein
MAACDTAIHDRDFESTLHDPIEVPASEAMIMVVVDASPGEADRTVDPLPGRPMARAAACGSCLRGDGCPEGLELDRRSPTVAQWSSSLRSARDGRPDRAGPRRTPADLHDHRAFA